MKKILYLLLLFCLTSASAQDNDSVKTDIQPFSKIAVPENAFVFYVLAIGDEKESITSAMLRKLWINVRRLFHRNL
jgi:hypothetical protein